MIPSKKTVFINAGHFSKTDNTDDTTRREINYRTPLNFLSS